MCMVAGMLNITIYRWRSVRSAGPLSRQGVQKDMSFIRWYTRTALFLAIILCGMSACTTPKAPTTPYAQWVPPDEEKDRAKNDAVWHSLRNQEVDETRPLVLPELIDMAMRNNPDLRQAWETARAAQANVGVAQAPYMPTVTVSGNGAWQKSNANSENDVEYTSYGPKAAFTWLLLDMGGRSAGVEKAVQQLLSANYSFNQTLLDLLQSIRNSYYGLYSAQLNVDAAQSNVVDSLKTYDAAKVKTESGLGIELDVLQAETSWHSAQYTLASARQAVQQQRASLALALGVPADTAFEIAPPTGALPAKMDEENIRDVIDQALAERPDIAALRASVAASRASVRVARSAMLPSLAAGASTEKEWLDASGDTTLVRDDQETTMAYLALTWDIFSGFANLRAHEAAEAQYKAEEAQLALAELQASGDIWTKYYAYTTAISQLTFTEAGYTSAQASFDLAFASYNAGISSFLDLLSAQTQLSDARIQVITARADVYESFVNLAHATAALRSYGTEEYDEPALQEQ
ncbi:MAG: TolC family protein [Spartobacteria bacterium]|nr:TolC family protein [Spartobacteria bacterium]